MQTTQVLPKYLFSPILLTIYLSHQSDYPQKPVAFVGYVHPSEVVTMTCNSVSHSQGFYIALIREGVKVHEIWFILKHSRFLCSAM